MKKFSILFTILLLLFSAPSFGQNTLKKWYLSGGFHMVNFPSARGYGQDLFEGKHWSAVPPLSQLTVARNLNRSFSLDLQASLGEINNKRLTDYEHEFMVLVGLGLRYRFANGYILKEMSRFDPYVRFGANYHRMPYRGLEFSPDNPVIDAQGHVLENGTVVYDDHFAVSYGLGTDYWLNKKRTLGLNVELLYVDIPATHSDYIDFFQAKAGISFRFGKSDRDGDGIWDEDDECPDVPGLAEFNGCPDSDGDGIEDRKDDCPLEACPNGEETDEYYCVNGCKVMKEIIEEPEEEVIVIEVPEEPEIIVEFEDVLFDFDKYNLKPAALEKVKEAAMTIIDLGGKVYIDGYTDSTGPDEYNMTLSKKRADSVKDALIKDGVDPELLETRGFGKSDPKCTNETREGRACNRRVVIIERLD